MKNMSLRIKENICHLIAALFLVVAIIIACCVTENKISGTTAEISTMICLVVFACVILYVYGFSNSEYTYMSLSKQIIQAVKASGKIMNIEDVEEKCKYAGLVPEYDMRVVERDVDKILVMSNGDKYRVKEKIYVDSCKDTEVTVTKIE